MKRILSFFSLLFFVVTPLFAQETSVVGRIVVASDQPGEVVVWLVPINRSSGTGVAATTKTYSLVQKGHQFSPHLLVIPVGARVDFPNQDPVFHNVFSLFDGRRFDLGLYEAGASKRITFNRPGVSYIFCNIHKDMSAVVIALNTTYFAVRQRDGSVKIDHVPYGKYSLSIWAEGAEPDTLRRMQREITIDDISHSIGTISLLSLPLTLPSHKNKYGMDYRPEAPDNPAYVR
jgi:plastocyanin